MGRKYFFSPIGGVIPPIIEKTGGFSSMAENFSGGQHLRDLLKEII